jgi:hypothetical protein
MNATADSTAQEASGRRWLLLIHQLPPKPDYLRVKVRRRLKRIGAIPIKQTVYALPSSAQAMEDLQWLRQEIEAEGGSAVIAEAAFVEGIADEELDAMRAAEPPGAGRKSRRDPPDRVKPGRTWVTRRDVFVDRMASAWLIRRFIDPRARFKFVDARGYHPRSGELRYDMFDAEYTHVGSDCTFQTLVKRFDVNDRALNAIGEIVHDIDCKDDLFNRRETAGVASLIRGIVNANATDAARIERGLAAFDDLYASFRKARK